MTAHTGSPYKGNIGNLMQHWTFCKLLALANENEHESHLNFIDAHAMAPFATRCTGRDCVFDKVQKELPGQGTHYEQAWRELVPEGCGYPNSAAFLKAMWKGSFSLLLCEIDCSTAAQLKSWTDDTKSNFTKCRAAETYCGNWRDRFDKKLPEDGLTFISFDPNLYNRHDGRKHKDWNLYPSDLKKLLCSIRDMNGRIIVQLSTYSANDGNSQKCVKESIDGILVKRGYFKRVAEVKANSNMMSLIYARNIDWADKLQNLGSRFEEWLEPILRG